MHNLSQQEQEQLSETIEKIRRSCPRYDKKGLAKPGERTVRMIHVRQSLEETLERR